MAKQKDRYILLFLCVISFLLRIFYISKVKGPFVYTDELGYWGHAANLAGNNWAGVMNQMPWYAFGYSLILAPLFFLTADAVGMYRMAVVLNAAFGLLSLVMAYRLACRMRKKDGKSSETAVWAFTALCFSAYIFNSYIAWSETLLSFLVWLLLYEMAALEESPACWKGIVLGAAAGYGYMVHNRMLSVVVTVLLITAFLLWRGKIAWKHLLCVFGSAAAVFLLNVFLKDVFRQLFSENSVLQSMGIHAQFSKSNTLSQQIVKIGQVFTPEGFRKIVLNVCGQVWQILSATYLLAGMGIAYCISKVREAIKEKETVSLYLFPVTALLFTTLMTALFFIEDGGNGSGGPVRIDTLFYGRYNDVLMGALLIAALVMLCTRVREKAYHRMFAAVYVIYLAVSGVMYFALKDVGDFYLNIVSAESIHMFHWLGQFAVWKCVLIALAVSGVCLAFAFVKLPEGIRTYLICGLLTALFFATAFQCMRLTVRGENDYTQQYAQIYAFLNENTETGEPVFTLEGGKFAYDLQTRLPDKMVICIDEEQIRYVADSQYLVVSGQSQGELADSEYTACLQSADHIILQKKED